ncbi:exonuclease domain-containing protein [Mycoplasmopsis columbina]|nr:exonuclease domain-containing protein [Mycoplasmopsis columbina]
MKNPINIPTKEQQEIIDSLKNNNVIVQAFAGAGKTTTILQFALQNPDKKILALTYNRKLMDDGNLKLNEQEIFNTEIYTFHSFASVFFNQTCKDDISLHNFVRGGKKHLINLKYDVIFIDEAQDLTQQYLEFIILILENNQKDYKLAVIGDKYQSVYEYLKADPRYLEFVDKLIVNKYPWVKKQLTTSFRITTEMAEFVNEHMFGDNLINSPNKLSNSVFYQIYDYENENDYKVFINQIKKIIERHGQENIFILSPVTKPNFFIGKKIANDLTQLGFNIYYANNEDQQLSQNEIRNKLVFSTIHQSKGLERDVAIVIEFDNSYFKWFDKKINPFNFNNLYYVAATRAKKELYLIHDQKHFQLPFLQNYNKLLENYAGEFKNKKILFKLDEKEESNTTKYNVSSLTKHLDKDLMIWINDNLKFKELSPKNKKEILVDDYLTLKINEKEIVENISNISGTSITLYYAFLKNQETRNQTIKNLNTFFHLAKFDTSEKNKNMAFLKIKIDVILKEIQIKQILKPEKILFLSNLYNSLIDNLMVKITTIPENKHNWISQEKYNEIYNRMKIDHDNLEFEKPVNHLFQMGNKNIWISGLIDCIDYQNKNIIEFKFIKEFSFEHYIQLITYKYLLIKNDFNNFKDFKMILHNVKNNQKIEIDITNDEVIKIVEKIIEVKNFELLKIDDSSFIKDTINAIEKVKKENSLWLTNKNTALTNEINKVTYLINNFEKISNNFKRFLIIDIETFNHDPLSICSIGAILIENNEIIKEFNSLIKPHPIARQQNRFISTHNIGYRHVIDAPYFDEVWNKNLASLIDNKTLILAHNASFDITKTLKYVFLKYQINVSFNYACTWQTLKKILDFQSHSLESYKNRIGEKWIKDFTHHDALSDCKFTFNIFNAYNLKLEDIYNSKEGIKQIKNFVLNKEEM